MWLRCKNDDDEDEDNDAAAAGDSYMQFLVAMSLCRM